MTNAPRTPTQEAHTAPPRARVREPSAEDLIAMLYRLLDARHAIDQRIAELRRKVDATT
jgi:hypothetical protein